MSFQSIQVTAGILKMKGLLLFTCCHVRALVMLDQMSMHMQGMRFGELFRVFPDAIVLGVSDKITGKTILNPPADFQIGPDESLVHSAP